MISPDNQANRPSTQTFGFQQLRQACEISTLRQEISKILDHAAELHTLIEKRAEQISRRAAELTPEDMHDTEKLSLLLNEAVAALLDLQETSRRMETTSGLRNISLQRSSLPALAETTHHPPPVALTPSRDESAPPPEPESPPPEDDAPPLLPRSAPTTVQASPPATRAGTTNWLMPAKPQGP